MRTLSKLNFWHGLFIATAVLLFLYVKSCNKNLALKNEIAEVQSYKDTVLYYKAKNGEYVSYNESLKVSFESYMLATNDSIKDFLENIRIPKPEVITVIKEVFYVDSIPSVSLGIADCDFDTTFKISDSNYEIAGRVTDEALKLESILIPNKMTLVIGNKKQNWWSKKEYIATVKNTNPYIKTDGIQSFTFSDESSRFSFGPNLGYGVYYNPFNGDLGHGVICGLSFNFRLFNFGKKR